MKYIFSEKGVFGGLAYEVWSGTLPVYCEVGQGRPPSLVMPDRAEAFKALKAGLNRKTPGKHPVCFSDSFYWHGSTTPSAEKP